MTDHLQTLSHDGTAPAGDCAQFEERFMAYLERELAARDHAWMDAHRAHCAMCDGMARDVESIVTQAGALAGLAPSRDLWSGIAQRIDTPVTALPLSAVAATTSTGASLGEYREKRGISVRRFAVAATVLVAVSSGITWRIASSRREATPSLAATTTPAATNGRTDSSINGIVTPVMNADVVYEQQIVALRTIVDQRFRELDPNTVKELQRNLQIIDKAIDDSKAALAKDPNSRVISNSLDRALANKLSLMRRVALL